MKTLESLSIRVLRCINALSRCLIGVCVVVAVIHSGVQSAFANEALGQSIQIDIPENASLESALVEWGTKAGLTVMINTETVGNRVTKFRIRGMLSARKALILILQDSGLSYTAEGDRIRIVPIGALSRSGLRDALSEASELKPSIASSSHEVVNRDRAADLNHKAQEGAVEVVVVTAQKREERLQEVPVSISAIGGGALDYSTFQGMSDALSTVPGVALYTAGEGGGTQLIMRGVTTAGYLYSGPGAIAYYVDSVPFGLVRGAIVPDPEVFDLDRVEILRGPQGTLYGASSLGGVVRVLTKDADLNNFDFKARTSVSTTESGGGNYRGDMAVNIPIIDGKLAIRAVVGDESLSGWINEPSARHVNFGDVKTERFKVNAQPTDELSIRLSIWRSRATFNALPEANDDGQYLYLGPSPGSLAYTTYDATVDYVFPHLTVTSSTGYLDFTNPEALALSLPDAPLVLQNTEGTRAFSEEFLLTSRNSGLWTWHAGLFYRHARDHTYQYFTFDPVPGLDNFDDFTTSYAAFGEFGHRLFIDQLTWTLGARYFHDKVGYQNVSPAAPPGSSLALVESTFDKASPRAVLTWKPSVDAMLYASYSQGFRSGWQQSQFVFSVVPNAPAIKPDTLNNYEVGAKGELFDHSIAYNVSAYYMKWRDIQQVICVVISPNVCATEGLNADSASGPGVDIEITTKPLGGLELGVTGSWNDLKINESLYSGGYLFLAKGTRPLLSPEYTLGGSVAYAFPFGDSGFKGRMAVAANYTSQLANIFLDTSNPPALPIPNNPVVNGRASFTVDAPAHWTAMLYVDNFTNYRGSPSRGAPNTGPDNTPLNHVGDVRLRPRTIGAQVMYSYK